MAAGAGIASWSPPLPDEVSCAHHEPRRHHHPIRSMPRSLLTYATPGRAASTRHAPTRRTPGFSVLVYLSTSVSSTNATVFDAEIVDGRRPRIRVSSRESRGEEKKCRSRGGKEGAPVVGGGRGDVGAGEGREGSVGG